MRKQKKTEVKQHFSKVLKELRLQRGWTQGDLAKYLGVTTGAVGNWETQANCVTVRRLKVLSDKLGLPIEYFRGGSALPGAAPFKPSEYSLTDQVRRVPVVTWARAGKARDHTDLAHPVESQVETDCKDPDCFAVIVEGDAMEPEFLAGDLVLFAPNSEPRNGDVVVCRLKEKQGVLLKRFRLCGAEGQTVRLESANPNYQPIEFQAREMGFIYPAAQLKRKLRK